MNKIEINIGLGNNPFTSDEVKLFLVKLLGKCTQIQLQVGEWEGADEDTLVFEIYTDIELDELREYIDFMTIIFEQDAIAFRFNGTGELVFHEDYKGERYPFDEAYFLTIK